jgi:hypothetical protein
MKTKPRRAEVLEPIELASHYRPSGASYPASADGDTEHLWKEMKLLRHRNAAQSGVLLSRLSARSKRRSSAPLRSVTPSAEALQ